MNKSRARYDDPATEADDLDLLDNEFLDPDDPRLPPALRADPVHTLKRHHRFKSAAAAFGLLILGSILLLAGLYTAEHHDSSRATGFFIISTLLLIPGVYQSLVIVRALRKQRGYSLDQVPSFDNI